MTPINILSIVIIILLIFSYHPKIVQLRTNVRNFIGWPSDMFTNSREPPSDSPIPQVSDANAGDVFTSYSEDIRKEIDPSIVESHREFVSDADFVATTGSSHAVSRDDFVPPVPYYGLPRKAHYMNTGAEKDARVVQSETLSDTFNIQEHHNTSYVL